MKNKRMAAAAFIAAVMAASSAVPVFAAPDTVFLDEDFNGLAAEGEILENKLIRPQSKKNDSTLPADVWSINATDWSDSNVRAEEPIAFTLPYGGDTDYSAYFYSSQAQAGYARMDFTGGKFADGDTLITEGMIDLGNLRDDSGSLPTNASLTINLLDSKNTRKQIFFVRHVIDGPSGRVPNTPNSLAAEPIYYSIAITLDDDNPAECPAYISLSSALNPDTEYYSEGTIDLSSYAKPSDIVGIRCGVTIPIFDTLSDSGSVDDMYKGIYFDNAKLMKAGDFEMTSADGLEGSTVTLGFSHAFRGPADASDFTVQASDGSTASVTSAEYDASNPTEITLTIDESTLKPGTAYTVSSSLQDVLGNTPSTASFTTESAQAAPEVSAVSAPQKFSDEMSVAYAYTFTVKPNGRTISGIRVSSDTELSGNTEKTVSIPAAESEVKFGIIAVHALAEGESAGSITAPEFTAEAF